MRIGYALTGSFCTFERSFRAAERLIGQGHELWPILSFQAASTDTRFGTAQDWLTRFSSLCGKEALTTLPQVEPIGPKKLLDILAVAPCTGTTLGRLSCGISETPVTLAVKSQLRAQRPVVLAVSTNDALGMSMRSLALLKNVRHMYFVPMRQDDVVNKPNSLVADFDRLEETLLNAAQGEQIQPLFL